MSQCAELHNLELVKVIQDVASGAIKTRDGIEEIKSEVRNGNVLLELLVLEDLLVVQLDPIALGCGFHA